MPSPQSDVASAHARRTITVRRRHCSSVTFIEEATYTRARQEIAQNRHIGILINEHHVGCVISKPIERRDRGVVAAGESPNIAVTNDMHFGVADPSIHCWVGGRGIVHKNHRPTDRA